MEHPWVRGLLGFALLGLAGLRAPAQEDPDALRHFEARVRPVLAEHCFRCHGPDKQKGGLRLDSRAALLDGGDQGPAIVVGDPEKSLLMKALRQMDDDLKMPPSGPLPREKVEDFAKWIRQGAVFPGAAGPRVARGEKQITDKDRQHWAFQPVRRAAVPEVKQAGWVANPIDAFIAARLEARGLAPNPPASRAELLRRITYNAIGLPPAPRQVEDFVQDQDPKAYEALVEKLLDSPQFGEKWARHWLDLVRYAETNSYERDAAKPHIWRYRDYVIRAFNADKPYDQFLREQLAGDEMPDAGPEQFIATGFYRLGIWDDEPSDKEQARYDELDDLVATVSQGMLGLTMDCARCHDHKIDPVLQRDYYQLLAYFHNITPGPKSEHALNADEKALVVAEAGRQAPATYILARGNPGAPGAQVEPGIPAVLEVEGTRLPQLAPPAEDACTSGRRSQLAGWIASPSNPLTARVIVNRLWQHHFGRGLVRSPNNFGLQGDRPTHPELLDWLALELMEHGWSLRHIHRLIMTSNTYRMSSRGRADALQADPANDLFWRVDMRRLSAEEIRDSILAVSGNLNLRQFGPSVYPEIPREVLSGQSKPGDGWGKSTPEEQARRSVYVHVKRSLLLPILEAFDVAETDRSAPTRFASTQPAQALLMVNSDFIHKQAEIFAERLRREAGGDVAAQVRLGLRLALCRQPSDAEVRRGADLIAALSRDTQDEASQRLPLRTFCLMVLNLSEFVYLD